MVKCYTLNLFYKWDKMFLIISLNHKIHKSPDFITHFALCFESCVMCDN